MENTLEAHKASKYVQVKLEAQSKSGSVPSRIPGPVRTKTDAQDAYGVRWRRSLYAWKAKKITFPMDLVPWPNSFGVVGNLQNTEGVLVLRHRFGPSGLVSFLGPLGSCPGDVARP